MVFFCPSSFQYKQNIVVVTRIIYNEKNVTD